MRETKFKQTEVGLIPCDWNVKTVKCIAPLQRGFDLPTAMLRDGNVPVVYSNGICNFHNKSKCIGPGLVTGRSGTIGKFTFIASGPYWPHNTSLWVTSFKGNNPLFVYYLYSSLKIEDFSGGSGVPTLNRNNVHEKMVAVPSSIEEQKHIAQALSDVDAVISTTEKLIAKKKALKQGTMQTLLSGKMRIQNGKWIKTTHFKQTELGPIPQEWEVRRLSNLGIFSKGCGISRDESNTGVIPAVRYGELYTTHNDYIKSFTSHISKDVASKARLLKKGDLLFTCSGETKEDIGKCVAFIGDEVAYAGGDLMILTPSININSLFYGFLLNTSIVVKQKSSRAQGDAVVHISSDSIGKILVPFPPQAEQTAIATVLSDMDSEIAAQETKLAKYRQLKTGMMQQLLTGKIRLV